MNDTMKRATILAVTLALFLSLTAWAEPSEALKGVYEALLQEGSSYSETKALYGDYYPDAAFEEVLADDGITISITGSEYMDGSWTFTQEGDYLNAAFSEDDFSGISLTMQLIQAVGACYGIDVSLISGYVNGISLLGIEDENFAINKDEATGDTVVKINIAGPWDMALLDQMALDNPAIPYEPLNEDYTSRGMSAGKLMMIADGSADSLTILLGEYGGLDELGYRSILGAVSGLQPKGWETFVSEYTELRDAEGTGYSVVLNADADTVGEIIDDASPSFSYAVIRFGA